ncbi:MAG TPA: folylpolyglutamate synthase/dihydrofolate synthase family protein [Nocardioidaceae bacterium]|nr:folylpolyglutamate synthase/dihydrofolate synthase family protein [Nocardioidaceae bacterium]
MTSSSRPHSAAPSYADVERALLARWPETRLDPTLARIKALVDLLGDPQTSYPVIHITGTNGKSSTGVIVDALLRGLGLRAGRYGSPHLESMTERISIDGAPISTDTFVRAYEDVAPYVEVVDRSGPHPMSYFEIITGMAYAAFSDAPVDVAVVEVGMGGTWDATNVADAQVAVVTPIAVDHAHYLGDRPEAIAEEKAGIIKAGSYAVLAQQPVEAAEVLLRHAAEVGATVAREGVEFGVVSREPAIGGQLVTLRGLAREYDEIFLPLFGAYQAHNAAAAVAAVEAFVGGIELDLDVVREAIAQVSVPGRLEVIRRSPTILLDAAHNPAGAEATMEAVQEAFAFSPLIGVVGAMADKDVEEMLAAFEPVMAHIVCSQNSTARAMPASELGELAEGIFGPDRVHVRSRLDDAIDVAAGLAEEGGSYGEALGSGGVLVIGSVVTAGEARTLLGRRYEG